jgi:hypothetical protein
MTPSMMIMKHAATIVEPVKFNDGKLSARWVATSEREDREGDIVKTAGGDLTDHRRVPVVLLDHNPKSVIGKTESPDGLYTIEPRPELGKMYATVYYQQHNQLGVQSYQLVKDGYLRGASIGFSVRKAVPRSKALAGGRRPPLLITEWSLCELSNVGVPMNPDAVREKMHAKIDGKPIHPHLAKMLAPLASEPKVWANGWADTLAGALSVDEFRKLRVKSGFDPNEPRDEDGKWTTGGGATEKTRFVPAASKEEAEEYAKRFSVGKVSYRGVDTAMANAINEVLTTIYDSNPNAPKLYGIEAKKFNGSRGFHEQAPAAYNGGSGTLYINTAIMGKTKSFAEYQKQSKEAADFVRARLEKGDLTPEQKAKAEYLLSFDRDVVDSSAKGIINHEFGHHVDYKVLMRKDNIEHRNSTLIGEWKQKASAISSRAVDNAHEYIAEAFAAYRAGEDIDPDLKAAFTKHGF